MSNQKVNGFANWETWNFKIWMETNENDYKTIIKEVKNLVRKNNDGTLAFMKLKNRDHLKLQLLKPEVISFLKKYAAKYIDATLSSKASFVNDFVNKSFQRIDFYELAEVYIEVAEEEIYQRLEPLTTEVKQ